MIVDQALLDDLTARAKESPRLRMNYDLRNSPADGSQRMLNAIEPGTVLPIHRHRTTSETVVCLRGHFEEYFYDEEGRLTDTIDSSPAAPSSTSPPANGTPSARWKPEQSCWSVRMGRGSRWGRRMC